MKRMFFIILSVMASFTFSMDNSKNIKLSFDETRKNKNEGDKAEFSKRSGMTRRPSDPVSRVLNETYNFETNITLKTLRDPDKK